MRSPAVNDLILRGNPTLGYELVDAVSCQPIGERVPTVGAALAVAHERGASRVWQQNLDNRGRPLGDLIPIPDSDTHVPAPHDWPLSH
jgi:hypothetical protein